MKFIETKLKGAFIITPDLIFDERGFFARTFCQKELAEIGFNKQIFQINHSMTTHKGTIRGMHYQHPPACEIKIIRCIQGAAFDVMIDLRPKSFTFKQWFAVELSKDNMHMVYIPEGFAHGFQTITDNTELIYHHSAFYSPEHELGLRYDDPALMISWPFPVGTISPKDQSYALINDKFKGIEI